MASGVSLRLSAYLPLYVQGRRSMETLYMLWVSDTVFTNRSCRLLSRKNNPDNFGASQFVLEEPIITLGCVRPMKGARLALRLKRPQPQCKLSVLYLVPLFVAVATCVLTRYSRLGYSCEKNNLGVSCISLSLYAILKLLF